MTRARFRRDRSGCDRAAFFRVGNRLDVCMETGIRDAYTIHCNADGPMDCEVCLCDDAFLAASVLYAWNLADEDFCFSTSSDDVPDLDWVSRTPWDMIPDFISTALDWQSLDGKEREAFLERGREGRTVIIDRLDSSAFWEGRSCLALTECSVEEGIGIRAQYERLGDVEFDPCDVAVVANCLFDESTTLSALKGVLSLSPDFTVQIMDKSYSPLALACIRQMSDECLSYLVENGCRFSVRYDRIDGYDVGLKELVVDLFDSPELVRIFSTVLSSGYRTSTGELFDFMAEFLEWSIHSGCLIRHEEDSDGKLDEVRCRQFDSILRFFPEEVFSYRDCCGDTLLSIASRELGWHRVLSGLFMRILDHSPDVNFINEDGETALDKASDGGFALSLIERGAVHGPGEKKRESNAAFGNHAGACDQELFDLIEDYGWSADEEYFSTLVDFLSLNSSMLDRQAVNKDGETVFMSLFLQDFCKPSLYDSFLEAGYDINSQGTCGETALFSAMQCPDCHIEHLEWLLDHGADWRIVNGFGQTVFHQAAGLFHCTDETWACFDSVDDKDIFMSRNKDGHSPLYIAFVHMNMPAIRFLMKNGCVPEDELDWFRHQASLVNGRTVREELSSLFEPYGGL